MANVRDSDTSLWLHNKLGTSNDSWTGGSICSQLNSEVLRNVKECFPDLQTQVKLKLLLSFFQIPHRNIQEWRVELEEILEIAQADSDRWVSVMAEILRNFPTAYTLNVESFEVKENKRIFDDLVHDLKKQLKKPTDFNMLPLECHYLNRSALVNVIGQPPVPKKHFTLKRKPKSAAVKADLVQKSTDLSNNMKKNISPAVPVRSRGMPRKMTDTTPMKGIPSRLPSGGFKTSILSSNVNRLSATRPLSGRKDCAIKLLDINEQPIGYAQAKKRKRMQELEESKRNADELSNNVGENSSSDINNSQNGDVVQSSAAPATPHYAAGLTALNKPTPSIVPAESKSPPHASNTPLQPPSTPYSQTYFQSSPTHTPQTPQTPQTPMYTPVIMESSAVKDDKPTANANTIQKQQTSKQQQQTTKSQQQISQTQPQQTKTVTSAVTATKNVAPQKTIPVSQDSPYLPKSASQINIQPELLQEAIERFKTANVVTPPEKLLILSFMAGSRENPCPQLGSVMTIKLSENKVSVQQPNGTVKTMSVEIHFQMNYNTGEWSWIEKKREIDTSTLSSLAAVAAAAANNESFPQQQLAS